MTVVTLAMALLVWGSHAIAAPDPSPNAHASGEPVPAYQFMLDADTCLRPQEGLFAPTMLGPYDVVVRELLLADTGDDIVLSVVVRPSFASPYSLRLEQPRPSARSPDAARPYHLRIVRTKGHPWSEMMEEIRRQQGNTLNIGEAEQTRALAAVSRNTETRTTPVAARLADRLAAAWAGALARTQYLAEVRETADGSHIFVSKMDGITYDFWHDGLAGTTHSPAERSLLRDLADIVHTLAGYADAKPAAQAGLEKKLGAQLAAFERRLKRNEPCLRAEWPAPRKAN